MHNMHNVGAVRWITSWARSAEVFCMTCPLTREPCSLDLDHGLNESQRGVGPLVLRVERHVTMYTMVCGCAYKLNSAQALQDKMHS